MQPPATDAVYRDYGTHGVQPSESGMRSPGPQHALEETEEQLVKKSWRVLREGLVQAALTARGQDCSSALEGDLCEVTLDLVSKLRVSVHRGRQYTEMRLEEA